jgi:hypothetical protein
MNKKLYVFWGYIPKNYPVAIDHEKLYSFPEHGIDKYGRTAHPDEVIINVETALNDFLINDQEMMCITTYYDTVVTLVRIFIAEQKLSCDNVKFIIPNKDDDSFQEADVNEYGAILNWPDGFVDQELRLADRLDKAAIIVWKKDNPNN